ncbi:hypothetical protein IFM89_003077 [Coptis chinensis]|uniref:Uncharacterized protein n=1 Tax=Coptis chinensis TaxID=261450 RepID=A0A835I4W3_9MAGN|nr:hypothetical protein IFM89_003077 [Coptis chinensis]
MLVSMLDPSRIGMQFTDQMLVSMLDPGRTGMQFTDQMLMSMLDLGRTGIVRIFTGRLKENSCKVVSDDIKNPVKDTHLPVVFLRPSKSPENSCLGMRSRGLNKDFRSLNGHPVVKRLGGISEPVVTKSQEVPLDGDGHRLV